MPASLPAKVPHCDPPHQRGRLPPLLCSRTVLENEIIQVIGTDFGSELEVMTTWLILVGLSEPVVIWLDILTAINSRREIP